MSAQCFFVGGIGIEKGILSLPQGLRYPALESPIFPTVPLGTGTGTGSWILGFRTPIVTVIVVDIRFPSFDRFQFNSEIHPEILVLRLDPAAVFQGLDKRD